MEQHALEQWADERKKQSTTTHDSNRNAMTKAHKEANDG